MYIHYLRVSNSLMALRPTSALLAVATFLALALLVNSQLNTTIHDVRGSQRFDRVFAAAEESTRVIRVKKDGTGDFKTVTEAVRSIPNWNKNRVVVWIGGGEYREKVAVDVTKPYVTFYGERGNIPTITYDGTAAVYGTWNSATVAVESDYFMAVNVAFVNSAPMPDGNRKDAQAVAMRISGEKAAFYNCKFLGFQDTLCDDKGIHFFKDCFIQGTVDFIFGNAKSLYLRCTINSVANGVGVITAHGRSQPEDDTGFSFVYCVVMGTGDILLGRAWRGRARVVFSYTYMGEIVDSKGWSDFDDDSRASTVYYGEYKCIGPGSGSNQRVKYAKMLSYTEAKPFISLSFIQGRRKWILPPPNL